nr:MAG TPA_asm: hypothetical protein [Caudoviricetes sp.]
MLLLYMGKPHISIVNSHKSKPHILYNIYGVNPLFYTPLPPIIIDVKRITHHHRTGGRSAGERTLNHGQLLYQRCGPCRRDHG